MSNRHSLSGSTPDKSNVAFLIIDVIICVLITANDAYMRDFDLTIPSDCVAANMKERTDAAQQLMQRVLKADSCPSQELACAQSGNDCMSLQDYRRKRDFQSSPEPDYAVTATDVKRGLRFVVQKDDARNLHFELRLEHDDVLKSWAVPRGPSLDPKDKRLAIEVEDHPLAYADFEGFIPKGNYGAGNAIVWDNGVWHPLGDVDAMLRRGDLKFRPDGKQK